ncbi:MAG: STAS domain-containing protein [Actinobacteria bacterium]|nr:MAG: STAS domain-containing protein [Actinomycetota bacterium]
MIPFEVRTNVCDGLATVAVAGDLDCATAPRLRATLEGMAPGQNVVVDLSGTDFLDCAGVGVLLSSQRRLRQLGGDLVVGSPRSAVLRVLDITGVLGVITVAGAES